MKASRMKMLWLPICAIFTFLLLVAVFAKSVGSETAKAPDTIVIKYIQNKYGPVTFDHSKHAALAGNCGKCHHMHNESINSACIQCHSLSADTFKASVKQKFFPCSGCHTDYSAEAPGMPGLKVALHKKCFVCHAGMRDLGASPAGCIKTCHVKKSS